MKMRNKSKLFLLLLVGFIAFAPEVALAQTINFDMGQGPNTTTRVIQLILLMTVLTLAPSILVMVTSFTRITVVLSFLRSAIGVQQTPPNIVLVSLALFLTMFIMQPVFEQSWDTGIKPLMNNEIDEETSFDRSVEPFHEFMLKHTRPKDLELFVRMSKTQMKPETAAAQQAAETKPAKTEAKGKEAPKPQAQNQPQEIKEPPISLRILIPSFMISELRRAFEIGFLVFLPFLIIDMVVASILMSMGMMMLPPSMISLPFKIVFFVLVDGWYLICGSLVQSYGIGV